MISNHVAQCAHCFVCYPRLGSIASKCSFPGFRKPCNLRKFQIRPFPLSTIYLRRKSLLLLLTMSPVAYSSAWTSKSAIRQTLRRILTTKTFICASCLLLTNTGPKRNFKRTPLFITTVHGLYVTAISVGTMETVFQTLQWTLIIVTVNQALLENTVSGKVGILTYLRDKGNRSLTSIPSASWYKKTTKSP